MGAGRDSEWKVGVGLSRVVSCGFRMFGFNRVVPLDWLMVAGVCLEKSHRVHIDEREKTHTAPYHESEGLGSTYVTRLGVFSFTPPGTGRRGGCRAAP